MVSSEKAERGHSSTSHTGRPDPQLIKDLRAKAVASLQRTREKNSSTPIKEALIEANKAGSGTVIEQSGGQDNSKGSQPTTQVQGQEKDMHQDLDELLAQGKAAAAANHHLNSLKQTEEQSSTNPQGYMKMANESHPSEHGSKKSRQESANKYGNNAHEAKTVLTRHTRETSAPSELGEIVDDSETSKANPSKPEDGVKMKSTPVATSNSHNSYLSKPSSIAMDDRQMVKRNTVELRKQSVDRTPVSEPKRYSREESVHPSGSNVSTRTSQSKHWSEDSYRPMEPRKPSVGTVVRSSNDMRAPSREMYIRRYSDDRQQISHREYSPPRVVEITDHEGHWDEHPRTTTPREYRDSTARRVVVEQPAPPAPARKKMIDLTDSYWTDLEEWLDMTGYHDLSHRQQTLDRQRKLFQIEIEREELTRESQKALEQRAYMARAASIQPRDDVPRGGLAPTSLETRTTRAASVIEMPPPPLPGRDSREDREILRREDRKVDAEVAVLSNPGYPSSSLTYRDEGKSHVQYMESPVTSSDTSGAKRRYHSDEEDVERRPAEKIVRLDSRRTSATVGEDDLILRTPKSYSGSQRDGRRPKDDDGMEDRVNSDLARICGEEAAPRIPKGPAQRGRVATPTGSASRDRARSTSAQPWSRLKEVKITPYKVEENQFGNGQINKKRNDGLYGSSGAPFPERSLPQPTQKPYQVPYWKKNYNNNHTNNHNSNSDNYYNQRGDLFGNRMNEDGKAGKPHQSLLQQRSDHHFQLPLHSHNRGGRGRGRGNSQHHSFRMDRDHNPNERWHHYEPTTPLFDLDHGGQSPCSNLRHLLPTLLVFNFADDFLGSLLRFYEHPGVKFFVIKSFNLDNVKAAQREVKLDPFHLRWLW